MARLMCQSCGMPMKNDEVKGTERNGELSQKYCEHCYSDGQVTWPGATAEEMQVYCMGILTKEKHWPSFMARMATNSIPKLERWRRA